MNYRVIVEPVGFGSDWFRIGVVADVDSRRVAIERPDRHVTVLEGDRAPEFGCASLENIQRLMDDLWRIGIRPMAIAECAQLGAGGSAFELGPTECEEASASVGPAMARSALEAVIVNLSKAEVGTESAWCSVDFALAFGVALRGLDERIASLERRRS